MIQRSDILMELIYQKGYKNLEDFARANKLGYVTLQKAFANNSFNKKTLVKIGRGIQKNIIGFANDK